MDADPALLRANFEPRSRQEKVQKIGRTAPSNIRVCRVGIQHLSLFHVGQSESSAILLMIKWTRNAIYVTQCHQFSGMLSTPTRAGR
jgi:hypothetical protein